MNNKLTSNISTLISNLYDDIIKDGYDAISKLEAIFLINSMEQTKPKNTIEIGCATGFSTLLLTKASHIASFGNIYSVDALSHYYGIPDKQVGFVCDDFLNTEEKKLVNIFHPHTSFDIPDLLPDQKFEFAFIDGCHEHPWPTLDMIAILPFMTDESCIVHHDLNLYKRKRCMKDLGPKFIFDQFDRFEKTTITCDNPNIFSIKISGDYKRYASKFIDSLNLPWSLRSRPPAKLMFQIGHYIEKYWSDTELYHWYCFSLERYY